MNSLRALIATFDAAAARGERCTLATIVAVDGSSYRRPGARMLIGEHGTVAGGISPGCLEADVIERARQVMASGTPALLEYETASTGSELPWGLGLGCGGAIRVLIEPLATDSPLLTMLRIAGDERRNENGLRLTTTYGDDWVTHEAEPMSADSTDANAETLPGVLVESLLPPVPLVVFGAGPDAVPLVELAGTLGWHVEVVDPRARPDTERRFAMADRVTLARPDGVRDRVTITSRTMTVVMSHDYSHDVALLGFLLGTPARYIGVMGPARRTQRMLDELNVAGDENLAPLHAPAGLDIGADGPQEIALAIIAEMRAVLTGRNGGMLRHRVGGIQGHREAECPAAASAR